MKKVLKIVDASNLAMVLNIPQENASCRISRLKKKHGKPLHSIVTLKEWCEWNGLNLEEMENYFA